MVYPNLVEVISNVALGLNLKKFNSLTWHVPLQVSLLALINSTALHPGCSQDSVKGKYAKCLPGKLTWSVLLHLRRPFVHSQLRQPDTWNDVSNEFYKCYSSWHCLKEKKTPSSLIRKFTAVVILRVEFLQGLPLIKKFTSQPCLRIRICPSSSRQITKKKNMEQKSSVFIF